MRVAVVDVGSTSAHVDVVELRRSRPPVAPVTVKHRTGLSRAVREDGRIGSKSLAGLVKAVDRAVDTASRHGAEDMVAFATSVVRDAPNRDVVLARVAEESGVRLGCLAPRQEARLTYEGARAWRRPGKDEPLFVVDIGGGTMELACGTGRRAARAVSAPIGARRLTLEALPDESPRRRDVARLRERVRDEVRVLLDGVGPLPSSCTSVAASRIFQQLAVFTGGAGFVRGLAAGGAPGRPPALDLERLRAALPQLAAMPWRERARQPGISRSRAPYILTGALLAEALMEAAGLETLQVCPWGLREGISLRLQEALARGLPVGGFDRLRGAASQG